MNTQKNKVKLNVRNRIIRPMETLEELLRNSKNGTLTEKQKRQTDRLLFDVFNNMIP